ncbi:16011_t:CDS:2 [Gigaspora margarita]|uniref:16011_t:CDS:1 n=1 Tax=Gigaspora margarita TaxID=4874 RepID=A0ABM8W1I9_GIGMA|nr:16011_t:CDS:2 [Gigaspora margarita]
MKRVSIDGHINDNHSVKETVHRQNKILDNSDIFLSQPLLCMRIPRTGLFTTD